MNSKPLLPVYIAMVVGCSSAVAATFSDTVGEAGSATEGNIGTAHTILDITSVEVNNDSSQLTFQGLVG